MRVIITALLIGVLLAGTAFAEDVADSGPTLIGVEMFLLTELEPGIRGTGYTVIRGTEIETFNVEVLELIPDGGFDGGPMILARFTGEVVDFSNGIAGGYSGSPVYIKGKLLGAVSMAMPFTDTHIGGITPIQSMLKALPGGEEPDCSGVTVLPEPEDSGILVDEDGNVISFTGDYDLALAFNEDMRGRGVRRYAAVPAITPVVCAGLSPLVREMYSEQLDEMLGNRFQLIEAPAGRAGNMGIGSGAAKDKKLDAPGLFLHELSEEPPLKPGDACAVSFVEGDVEMYGIGTVTYSDNEGRFLLFGHPMFGEGKSSFPIGKAYITWVHGSIIRAFKDGVRLSTLGTVTGDHLAACGGSFEIVPDMIPVNFKFKDADAGSSITKRFRVMRHKDYTPLLIALGMSQAANEVLDRRPAGTLKLSYHIEGIGLKEMLRRTDYYYSDYNVLFNAGFELLPIADLLANNIYREVKITKVVILAEITSNRHNASIDDAEIIEEEVDIDDEAVEGDEEPMENIPLMDDEENVEEAAGGEAEQQVEEPVANNTKAFTVRRAQPRTTGRRDRLYQLNPDWSKLRGAWYSSAQQPPEQGMEDEVLPPDVYGQDYGMGEVPNYKPGEMIRVKVRLQPYRTEPVWREFSIQVPEDFPAGSSTLVIHGGGDLMSWSELGGKGRDLFGFGPIIDTRDRDLDAILDQIVEAPHNNELLLTLTRPYDYNMDLELEENGAGNNTTEDEEEPEDHVDVVYQMEWVIYNSYYLPVNIEGDEELEDMEEMLENGFEDSDEPYEGYEEEEYETTLPF